MSKKNKGGGRPAGRGMSVPGGGGMGNIMAQVQKLQEEMARTQEALGDEEITVTAGGGAVSLTVTGHREFRALSIKPEVVDPEDVEMLQDLILAAFNDALAQVQQLEDDRMGALTGGIGLPPGLI